MVDRDFPCEISLLKLWMVALLMPPLVWNKGTAHLLVFPPTSCEIWATYTTSLNREIGLYTVVARVGAKCLFQGLKAGHSLEELILAPCHTASKEPNSRDRIRVLQISPTKSSGVGSIECPIPRLCLFLRLRRCKLDLTSSGARKR